MYKVIIADDEQIVRKGLLNELSVTGDFELFEAKNGQEVIEIAKRINADGILLDIVMPKMTGIQVMEHIVSEGLNPIVFVISSHDSFQFAQTMLRYGVNDYILKPIGQNEVARISRDLKQKLSQKAEQREQVAYLKASTELLTTMVTDKKGSVTQTNKELDRLAEGAFFAAQNSIDDVKVIIDRGFDLFSGYDLSFRKFFKQHFASLIINRSLNRISGEHLQSALLAEMIERFKSDEELKAWLIDELTQFSQSNPISSKLAYYLSAKDFIEQHYAEDLSVSSIAERLYITPNYLGKIFKDQCGQGLLEYIKNIRLEEAVKIMLSGNSDIGDICEKTGFSDVRYFGKLFKDKYNVSPKQFLSSSNSALSDA